MTIQLDEAATLEKYRHIVETAEFRRGLNNMVHDPLCFTTFLMGVWDGELMGEQAVATLRQDEIANLIHGLHQQQMEEHGHGEAVRLIALQYFPGYFEDGEFRYQAQASGLPYYMLVREANRQRLKQQDKYTRLNLYMTTTFGYEIMVELYYGAVIQEVKKSSLPKDMRDHVASVLQIILDQEETHLGLIAQHNALLQADRTGLSEEACAMLDALGRVTAEDYDWIAGLAVEQIVPSSARFLDVEDFKRQLVGAPA